MLYCYCFGNLKVQEKGTYNDLAKALQNPKDVRILDLRGRELATLPKEIGQLKNLQELDLSYNQLW
ncbi:hypothetical protein [Leptospira santarosai]|uniref:hypothetical protein n=1 Tax=Leptospira santarosai TaxID=28183 RepID=UPI001F3C619B